MFTHKAPGKPRPVIGEQISVNAMLMRTGNKTVPDPDLEIRGRGGGGGRSSRPGDKGAGAVSKNLFGPFGPQFGLKIRGGGGPLPWIYHCKQPITTEDNNTN